MRISWKKAKPKAEKRFRVNQQIIASEIFLIDENGEQIGQVSKSKALQMAEEAGLDLVEVNPKDNLPICKIMDYGQFRYEREKKAHKQKISQKKTDTKGIRLTARIGEHDLNMRIDQAEKFLSKGHKLKLELFLRGREKAHPEVGVDVINGFMQRLEQKPGISIIREQDLTRQGGSFIMILVNKNSN